MVTCELLRVWFAGRQHNRQHVQLTRGREKLVQSGTAALGAFRKKVSEVQCDGTFLRFFGTCLGRREKAKAPSTAGVGGVRGYARVRTALGKRGWTLLLAN